MRHWSRQEEVDRQLKLSLCKLSPFYLSLCCLLFILCLLFVLSHFFCCLLYAGFACSNSLPLCLLKANCCWREAAAVTEAAAAAAAARSCCSSCNSWSSSSSSSSSSSKPAKERQQIASAPTRSPFTARGHLLYTAS